ncbi:MAG: TolC family protein [Leptospiraceae bacterium]|nr:TolC family protein [Leptospiraceae bacterium]
MIVKTKHRTTDQKNKKNQVKTLSKIIFLLLALQFLLGGSIFAEDTQTFEFGKIWDKIKENSHSQKALSLEARSAKLAQNKASKHWLPRVYADARNFTTNDPALNFFSTLGQRSATNADFSTKSMRTQPSNFIDTNNNLYTSPNYNTLNLFAPDTLNYPGTNTYQRGTLGVDFAIYEGGSKAAASKAYEKQAEGKQLENRFVTLSEYANFAAMYGTLLALKEQQEKINSLDKTVTSILSRYQLGNRANPVGYSGGIALKTVKNRIEGIKEETAARIESIKRTIEVSSGDLPENWNLKLQSTNSFADEHLKVSAPDKSYMVKAMKAYSEGATEQAEAEKARILPKVGLYGESYVYRGDRSTATSFNGGFYVQMNLYSPGDLDAIEQAKLNSKAAKERTEEAIKQEESKTKSLVEMEKALKRNLELVQESSKLMEEQISVTQQLFSSGAINALQLAEVYSRKADLVLAKSTIESEFLKARAGLLTLTDTTIEGNKYE